MFVIMRCQHSRCSQFMLTSLHLQICGMRRHVLCAGPTKALWHTTDPPLLMHPVPAQERHVSFCRPAFRRSELGCGTSMSIRRNCARSLYV